MTWFEFRENDHGTFDVVMLKGHPEDEPNKETAVIVATGLEEVDAEDDAEWRNECERDAVDYAREMADPEFDRSGGHY